ncbi:MAG: DUF4249 family protein [Ignavibacterium sp.]|jgi:hypothetical protein
MRFIFSVTTLLAMAAFAPACDTAFNPKAPFRERVVLYSILSTASDTVVVRASRTYDPPNFDPYERTEDPPIPDLAVTFFLDGVPHPLNDTVITRRDKSRYQTDIQAFILHPLSIPFGSFVRLNAVSPALGTFSATARMPSKGAIVVTNGYVLDSPGQYNDASVFVQVHLGPEAMGYLLRAFLEYDLATGGGTETRRVEVPAFYRSVSSDGQPINPEYPGVKRRESTEAGAPENPFRNHFAVSAFRITASDVHLRHPPGSVTIRRAVFLLNQIEEHLYHYYSIVNAWGDEFTIRVDEPGYSNVDGGEGVVGCYTVEVLERSLPPGLY